MFGRAAGIAAFVWAAGQAGRDAAQGHGLDAATASIIVAAIAGVVAIVAAVVPALIARRRPPVVDEDGELVKLALLVALRRHEAADDGDEELEAEQRMLARHLTGELERRRRAPEV